MALGAELDHWDNVRQQHGWASLLVGNGASRNVWARFAYASLYETACDGVDDPLTHEDQKLFDSFGTRNFEAVLTSLWMAGRVASVLGYDPDPIEERYESIRRALIQAVREVHVPWPRVPEPTLDAISAAMQRYERIYTTNYDLLLYWALMRNPDGFRDYFWGAGCFDATDTERYPERRPLLFLHGAIHLHRGPAGDTCKLIAEPDGANLLELFEALVDQGREPLFVSEGRSEEKEAAIRRSDYLTFALERFASDRAPLVVFGQSLGEQDRHLVKALRRHPERVFAVSVRRHPNDERVIARKAEVLAALPNREVWFFSAQTHPLGAPELRAPDL